MARPDETEIEQTFVRPIAAPRNVLVIACGAIAREILAIAHGPLGGFDVACLPAKLHNRPDKIPEAVRGKIRLHRSTYDEILVLYGDCGTGGRLDAALAEENVTRIAGAHCYDFFAGEEKIVAMMEEEPGTFFVTDFLARHFERLVVEGLGLDRYPQLRDDYFGHYQRLVYLAQIDDAGLTALAENGALRLGLAFERRFTGLRGLTDFFEKARQAAEPQWQAL